MEKTSDLKQLKILLRSKVTWISILTIAIAGVVISELTDIESWKISLTTFSIGATLLSIHYIKKLKLKFKGEWK